MVHVGRSDYNVFVDAEGPVIIDLPQAIDAAGNNTAASLLARGVFASHPFWCARRY